MPAKKGVANRPKGGKSVSSSVKAGVVFPVGRIASQLKKGMFARRIGGSAAAYLAAVMEYIMAEVIEVSADVATEHNKQSLFPRHLQLAIRNDDELSKLFSSCTINGGGVLPNIDRRILPLKQQKEMEKAEGT